MTEIIDQALKPLKSVVSKLSDRLLEQEAAAEVVSRTTEKGLPYEIEVVERLQPWAKAVGATVEHVGTDNQPGDVVVRFAQTSIVGRALTVVVEARDRADAKGLKRVTADVEAAMRQRQATAAVYVGRTPAAFAKEIGEWTDGRGESGPFIACVDGSLEVAMRFIVALARLDDMHQAHHELDATAIQPYVGQIENLAVTRFVDLRSDDRRAVENVARRAAQTVGRITLKKPTPEFEDVVSGITDTKMETWKKRFGALADAV